MELIKLAEDFSVCKLASVAGADLGRPFTFLSVTDEEISLVCPAKAVPKDALVVEGGWRALKISGVLDFGMIGVIAGLSGLLARAAISVFVVSTYNTDYILLKADRFEAAVELLAAAGYRLV